MGWGAVTVSVTTVVRVFDSNTHNAHLYDEYETLLLLRHLYFETKTAPSELFVFGETCKSHYSYLAEYLKVVIRYSPHQELAGGPVLNFLVVISALDHYFLLVPCTIFLTLLLQSLHL